MNDKYILVVGNKDNFIFPYIKEIEVCNLYKIFFENKIINRLAKIIYGFLVFIGLCNVVYDSWYKKLIYDGYSVVFLDECGIDKSLVKIINKYSSRTAVYCWNPAKVIKNFSNYKYISCPIKSFDKNDCDKFNFGYKGCIVPDYDGVKNIGEPEYDLFFLGYDKGRSVVLNKIRENSKTVNCNFVIIDDQNLKNANPFTYSNYVDLLVDSKAVVELLQSGQSGETMRTVESIMLKKKLITNNKALKNELYYDPANMLIIDLDAIPDEQVILDFISTPYNDNRYEEFENRLPKPWIKSFFGLR